MRRERRGHAAGWKESGKCLKTTRSLPEYFSCSALRIGSARAQNGHWKSEYTTSVSGASFGPSTGELPTSMS